MTKPIMGAPPGVLSICVVAGRYIRIGKTVLQVLRRPAHLTFWWGVRERVLAIGISSRTTEQSIQVPNYFYGNNCNRRIKTGQLMRALIELTGWENGSHHYLPGQYIPQLHIIVFRADSAGPEKHYRNEKTAEVLIDG